MTGKKTILVVDDEPDFVSIVQKQPGKGRVYCKSGL